MGFRENVAYLLVNVATPTRYSDATIPVPLSIAISICFAPQAFGVGAFEDEDEDIYGAEDMSNYDFESAPERAGAVRAAAPGGFRLAERSGPVRRRYPPPPLPPDFTGRHRARGTRFEPVLAERRGLQRHRLSADQRADRIGEQPASAAARPEETAPGPPALPGTAAGPAPQSGGKAETALTPPALPGTAAPQSVGKTEPGEAARLVEVLTLLADCPAPATPALRPFAGDPDKQARYEQFLRLAAANRKGGSNWDIGAACCPENGIGLMEVHPVRSWRPASKCNPRRTGKGFPTHAGGGPTPPPPLPVF